MIRSYPALAGAAALALCTVTAFHASAQQNVPAAPAETPTAPAPTLGPAAPVFPKADPANFTAPQPTPQVVSDFLQANWGYDPDRVWQVQAILKTQVEGISKVVVLIGDKTGKQKMSALQFFALPDGKHIIAGDEIIPFGAHPWAENRALLQEKADGPYHGAASKDLEIVEFADLQCPHCKDAQANMDKLAVDFPKARIVFQNYPLARIHPAANLAAGYGDCVTKLGGSTAFFQFASAVFDGQEGLATSDGATLTLNSAVAKAGLDPAKVQACATTPATTSDVQASVKLAQSLNVVETPTLFVNGRLIPMGGLPYDTLKKIVQFQISQDGVAAQ